MEDSDNQEKTSNLALTGIFTNNNGELSEDEQVQIHSENEKISKMIYKIFGQEDSLSVKQFLTFTLEEMLGVKINKISFWDRSLSILVDKYEEN